MQRLRVTLAPEKPDPSGPAAVVSPGGRRSRLAIAGLICAAVIILALSTLYLNRRTAAQNLLTGWLEQRGISAEVSIERLELDGFAGRIRLGDPGDPDVTLERIEVDYALGMPWSESGLGFKPDRIRLVRPMVRARLTEGRLSFGTLDPLIEAFTQAPPRKDSQGPVIVIENARLSLGTDFGAVDLLGQARVEDGRLMRLRAELATSRLEGGALSGSGLAGRVDLKTTGDRMTITLDASAEQMSWRDGDDGPAGSGSGDGLVRRTTPASLESRDMSIRVSGALPYPQPGIRHLDAGASIQANLTAGRLSSPALAMQDGAYALRFDGHIKGWLEAFALDGEASVDVTADRATSAGFQARNLSLASQAVKSRISRNTEGVQWSLAGPARFEANTAGAGRAGEALADGLGVERLVVIADRLSAGGQNRDWEVSGPAAFSAANLSFGDLALQGVTGRSQLDFTHLDGIVTMRAQSAVRSQGGRWSLLGPVAKDDVVQVAAMKRALGSFAVDFPSINLVAGSVGTEVVLQQPGRIRPYNGGTLTVRPSTSSLYSASWGPRGEAQGGGAFSLVGTRGPGLPDLTVEVAPWRLTDRGFDARLDARAALDFDVARGITLDTRGTLVSDRGASTFVSDGCTALVVQRLELGENDVEALAGQLCPSGRALVEIRGGAWRVDGTLKSFEASAPFLDARFEGVEGPVAVTGSTGGVNLQADITSGRVLDTARVRRFHPLLARGDVQLGDAIWAGGFEVLSGDYSVAQVTLGHDGNAGRGRVEFDTGDLTFNEPGLQPHDLTPLVLEAMQSPVRGQVRFTGYFAWDETQEEGGRSRGQLIIPGLDFESPAGPVQGLKGQIDFTSLAPLATADGQTLSVDRLETLTPLTELGLRFALDQAALKVAGGEIQAAGGWLKLEPMSVPLDTSQPFNGVVTLDRVQLGELLTGAGFGDRVALDAVVSGRLPFRWDPVEGVRIEAGKLTADQPGRLSIAREALSGLSAGGGGAEVPQGTVEDLAYQAMENLAFESLSADVNSLDAGRVGILFRIRGRHDPPQRQELRLSLQELISRSFLQRKLPLPSDTGIDLTLDTSLNLTQLVNDLLAARRPSEDEDTDGRDTVPEP